MRSPQDEINARKSKALWLMNSRRVVADEDAVLDHAAAMKEVARADAYIKLNPQRRASSMFKVEDGAEFALPQLQAMQEAKGEIAQASGVHQPMQGQTPTGVTSGIAMNSLIEQGITTLAEINDNYRFARRKVGELLFELVRRDLAGRPVKVTVGEYLEKRDVILNNRVQVQQPDGTIAETVENDVSRMRASIVLDDIPSTPTFRQQVLAQMMEMTKGLPEQLQAAVFDLIVASSDLPNKDKYVERIQKALGMNGDNQDPQMAQAQQIIQELQAAMADLQKQVDDKSQELALKAEEIQLTDDRERERIANEARVAAGELLIENKKANADIAATPPPVEQTPEPAPMDPKDEMKMEHEHDMSKHKLALASKERMAKAALAKKPNPVAAAKKPGPKK